MRQLPNEQSQAAMLTGFTCRHCCSLATDCAPSTVCRVRVVSAFSSPSASQPNSIAVASRCFTAASQQCQHAELPHKDSSACQGSRTLDCKLAAG